MRREHRTRDTRIKASQANFCLRVGSPHILLSAQEIAPHRLPPRLARFGPGEGTAISSDNISLGIEPGQSFVAITILSVLVRAVHQGLDGALDVTGRFPRRPEETLSPTLVVGKHSRTRPTDECLRGKRLPPSTRPVSATESA